MSQSKLDTFPKFPYLANELQDLIWEWSLEDRPPAAHFGQLKTNTLKTRFANGETGSMWTQTMLEDLSWTHKPRDLAEICHQRVTQISILLATCKRSRRVAIRYRRSWGPERTLQLYDPHDNGRLNKLDFSRDFTTSIYNWRPTGSLHWKYMPPRLYNLACRKIDNSRDLVILGPEWIGMALEYQTTVIYDKPEWKLPVQRVPYLALTYTTRFHESLNSQLATVTSFRRFHTEVLYILINPDEFDDDHTAVTEEEVRNTLKARRKVLETPFPKRKGASSLVADAPDRFWYGPREYYALSWDEIEEKMMDSAPWRQLTDAIEKARETETDFCTGCRNPDCNKRAGTIPVIWKIMSWRDPE
ncbi:hypothetical protein ACHAPT_005587 [Fusarium lateritium]